MQHLRTFMTVIGAALVIALVGNGISLAATGQGFVLGRTNSASSTTVLKRTTAGPPLQLLGATSASPPLAVNSTALVAHLDADLLDGRHANQIGSTTYAPTLPNTGGSGAQPNRADYQINGVAPGTYLVSSSLYLNGTAGDAVACNVYDWNPTTSTAKFATYVTGQLNASGIAGLSSAGVLVAPAGTQIEVGCSDVGNTANALTIYGSYSTLGLSSVPAQHGATAMPLG